MDKLKVFPDLERKNELSVLFLMAIGGGEAPGGDTSLLISNVEYGKKNCHFLEMEMSERTV